MGLDAFIALAFRDRKGKGRDALRDAPSSAP